MTLVTFLLGLLCGFLVGMTYQRTRTLGCLVADLKKLMSKEEETKARLQRLERELHLAFQVNANLRSELHRKEG